MPDGLQKSFYEEKENDIISEYSCKYDSKINDFIVPKQAKMIANCLLYELSKSNIISGKTVTYGDVSDKCEKRYNEYIKFSNSGGNINKRTGNIAKGSVGDFSDDINRFSAMYGLPFITCKIVAKNAKGNELPQDGFYKSLRDYSDIYGYNIPSNIDTLTTYEKENIFLDINNKIESDFSKIVEVFKILNDEKTFIIDDSEIKDSNDTHINKELITEVDNESINETDKIAYTKIRIGQSELRYKKLKEVGCCEICGLKTPELLIASHIKPWAESDDYEKLDTENILLLCATHDALFDKGFITFDRNGNIIISKELSEDEQALLNIHDESKINITSIRKINYLKHHSENIFKDGIL